MDSDLLTGSAPWLATPWLVAPWGAVLGAALLAVVALACTLAALRGRARSRRALEQVLAETEELRREVAGLRGAARPAAQPTVPYVITGVGAAEPPGPAAGPATVPTAPDGRIGGRLFADLVLRESAVKAGALAHGVRRALAPQSRHRIRFEMGREVKRARKQRRADLRDARRRLHAEQREGQHGEPLRQGVA